MNQAVCFPSLGPHHCARLSEATPGRNPLAVLSRECPLVLPAQFPPRRPPTADSTLLLAPTVAFVDTASFRAYSCCEAHFKDKEPEEWGGTLHRSLLRRLGLEPWGPLSWRGPLMRERGPWAESEEQGPEPWQVAGISQRGGRELCLPERPRGGFPYRVSWGELAFPPNLNLRLFSQFTAEETHSTH